ncbi:MAG: flagellar hook-basal body complex protein FliE [Candidatus Zixiibacteriota bacterium]
MSANIGNINRVLPGLQNEIGINKNVKGDDKGNFTEIFNNMLGSVNDLQMDAGKAQEMLATGDAAELHEVMLAAEKAGVAMDLLLEIRNKLVDAYQTMMRMPM